MLVGLAICLTGVLGWSVANLFSASQALTPENPSTLELALVGLGIIFVYLLGRRQFRSGARSTAGSGKQVAAPKEREEPSREAA